MNDSQRAEYLRLCELANGLGYRVTDTRADTCERFLIFEEAGGRPLYRTHDIEGVRAWLDG